MECIKTIVPITNHVPIALRGECLEALLEFLKSPAINILISGINIGPVHKNDIMQSSLMLEKKKKEYVAIMVMDMKVTPDTKIMPKVNKREIDKLVHKHTYN
jgi:translation initiation factor IF-2